MDEVEIDTRRGERGPVEAWVRRFADVWTAPRERLDDLLDLLSPDVVLVAPTTPSRTCGREAGRRAFERALRAMPDLTAEVHRWSASGDVLFIELTFQATIGGRRVRWRDVDRFRFERGRAVERVAFFDPSLVRRAFGRNPRAWRQLLRLRVGV
jgi:ketosteroid isomerase-like protein